MSKSYSEDHEWVDIADGVATVGISTYAQEQLGDVVFVELPEVGKTLAKGDEAAVVESVKAASEIYSPASGEIVETNGALDDDPAKVNSGAETDGWLFKIKLSNPDELNGLMSSEEYAAYIETL